MSISTATKRAIRQIRRAQKRTAARRTQKPRFEIYQEDFAESPLPLALVGGWRWRLVGRNGKILADSGEAYTRKHGVKRALGAILEAMESPDLMIVDLEKK